MAMLCGTSPRNFMFVFRRLQRDSVVFRAAGEACMIEAPAAGYH